MVKVNKMKDMKKILMTMVLGALMASLVPSFAQNMQDWQSTSTMRGAGSTLAPQVTAVGATNVGEMVTTTSSETAAKAPSGPRRGRNPGDPGYDSKSDQFPIGDAVLPLLLFAGAFLIWRAARPRAVKE